jgi:hypothetical protein
VVVGSNDDAGDHAARRIGQRVDPAPALIEHRAAQADLDRLASGDALPAPRSAIEQPACRRLSAGCTGQSRNGSDDRLDQLGGDAFELRV